MEAAIALKGVTRRFRNLVAVNDMTFRVQRGEIFGLLGPNGAGKTTIVNLITGLLRRHGGEVSVLGFDPESEPRQVRRRVGLVPQETNVYADLNAVDNLWHHAALYCDDLSEVRQRMEALLRLVGLWERRKDPVGTYSGGMKRRLVPWPVPCSTTQRSSSLMNLRWVWTSRAGTPSGSTSRPNRPRARLLSSPPMI